MIDFTLNGRAVTAEPAGLRRLIDVLRLDLGLTGTKEGCGEGECGACTVLLDGQAVLACLVPAHQVAGHQLTTIEGLEGDRLHALQEQFIAHGGAQCGICTPGMVLAAKALLDQNAHPTRDEVREGLAGNLCRCTGYQKIVDSVIMASHDL